MIKVFKKYLLSGCFQTFSYVMHYSLIESAKMAKLNPYEYLMYIFARLPYAKSREDQRKLLPWTCISRMARMGTDYKDKEEKEGL